MWNPSSFATTGAITISSARVWGRQAALVHHHPVLSEEEPVHACHRIGQPRDPDPRGPVTGEGRAGHDEAGGHVADTGQPRDFPRERRRVVEVGTAPAAPPSYIDTSRSDGLVVARRTENDDCVRRAAARLARPRPPIRPTNTTNVRRPGQR